MLPQLRRADELLQAAAVAEVCHTCCMLFCEISAVITHSIDNMLYLTT